MMYLVKFTRQLVTRSGIPITIGTGTGTKWQWLKKGRAEHEQGTLERELVGQLKLALVNGYNHIDTASFYTTQPEVGAAIRESGIKREDLFITSKYSGGFFGQINEHKNAGENIDAMLKELQLEYLDMCVIHSPWFHELESHGQTVESSWKHLIEAKKAGKVRHIGVSNFSVAQLQDLFKVDPDFHPEVNQIEFHPYLQNQTPGIVDFCQKNYIQVEAYGSLSPLFRIKKNGKELTRTEHPIPRLLDELAAKYNETDAQLLLRYTLQKGILPITTSSNEERIKESLDVVNFELSKEDIFRIDDVEKEFKFRYIFQAELGDV